MWFFICPTISKILATPLMLERLIHTSLPLLDNLSMTDPSRGPCLHILLKNLHHLMLNQYQYEEVSVFVDVSAFVDVSPCSLLDQ